MRRAEFLTPTCSCPLTRRRWQNGCAKLSRKQWPKRKNRDEVEANEISKVAFIRPVFVGCDYCARAESTACIDCRSEPHGCCFARRHGAIVSNRFGDFERDAPHSRRAACIVCAERA